MSTAKQIEPESSAGRALRALCQYKGPMPAPKPIVVGRRKTRPEAPYATLVKAGLATVETVDGVRMYQPTDTGRILRDTWT